MECEFYCRVCNIFIYLIIRDYFYFYYYYFIFSDFKFKLSGIWPNWEVKVGLALVLLSVEFSKEQNQNSSLICLAVNRTKTPNSKQNPFPLFFCSIKSKTQTPVKPQPHSCLSPLFACSVRRRSCYSSEFALHSLTL